MKAVRHVAGFAARAIACLVIALSAPAAPITVPFDHLATGFELDSVHLGLPCESCPLNAVFKGTPRNCGVCHISGSVFNVTRCARCRMQLSAAYFGEFVGGTRFSVSGAYSGDGGPRFRVMPGWA